MRKSLKSISNIKDFNDNIKAIIPKISRDNNYYFIILMEHNEYRTDILSNELIKINSINDYLTNINDDAQSASRDAGQPASSEKHSKIFTIDKIPIQDLLYFIIDDTTLFIHNKFTNIYYALDNELTLLKQNNYYSGSIFIKYFKLKLNCDEVYVKSTKYKRQYNKISDINEKINKI